MEKTVDSKLEDSYLTIKKDGENFCVTGYGKGLSCSVMVSEEKMIQVNNLTLYQSRFFPGTALQKVLVTMQEFSLSELWWQFVTSTDTTFYVRVFVKDFQIVWEEMHA